MTLPVVFILLDGPALVGGIFLSFIVSLSTTPIPSVLWILDRGQYRTDSQLSGKFEDQLMNFKILATSLTVIFLLRLCETTLAGGWGPVYAIEVHAEHFAEPLVITDPSTVEELSFWVGPGTGFSEFMGPVNRQKSIVDWDLGEVLDKPDGLTRYEIFFLLEPRTNPPKFTVSYEPDPDNQSGYIYYPEHKNSIVTHFVEGTWQHASRKWNESVGAAIMTHSD